MLKARTWRNSITSPESHQTESVFGRSCACFCTAWMQAGKLPEGNTNKHGGRWTCKMRETKQQNVPQTFLDNREDDASLLSSVVFADATTHHGCTASPAKFGKNHVQVPEGNLQGKLYGTGWKGTLHVPAYWPAKVVGLKQLFRCSDRVLRVEQGILDLIFQGQNLISIWGQRSRTRQIGDKQMSNDKIHSVFLNFPHISCLFFP